MRLPLVCLALPALLQYAQEEGYIDIEYQKATPLVDLQHKVLGAVNPLRDGLREHEELRLVELTGQSRTNVEQYGYRYIGGQFRPH